GFLHFGQGKWYPGEQLPRWALSIYWRTDGENCWQDPLRFADERAAGDYTVDHARHLMLEIATNLVVDPRHIIAGHEDVFYYLWRERRLPVNVDPFEARVDDELERARLCKVFDQGLRQVVGWALPLRRNPDPRPGAARWLSGLWFLRSERMYLTPGDSPMGYRLPLDSLPWVAETDREAARYELDPFAPLHPLPSNAALRLQAAPHQVGAGPGGEAYA